MRVDAGQTVVIGRKPLRPMAAEQGTIRLDVEDTTKSMSKRHARFEVADNLSAKLEDTGSTNGTYVVRDDGELMRIPAGQAFMLPRSPMRFQFGDVPVDFLKVQAEAPNRQVTDLFSFAAPGGQQNVDAASMSVDDILDLRAGEPTGLLNTNTVRSRIDALHDRAVADQLRQGRGTGGFVGGWLNANGQPTGQPASIQPVFTANRAAQQQPIAQQPDQQQAVVRDTQPLQQNVQQAPNAQSSTPQSSTPQSDLQQAAAQNIADDTARDASDEPVQPATVAVNPNVGIVANDANAVAANTAVGAAENPSESIPATTPEGGVSITATTPAATDAVDVPVMQERPERQPEPRDLFQDAAAARRSTAERVSALPVIDASGGVIGGGMRPNAALEQAAAADHGPAPRTAFTPVFEAGSVFERLSRGELNQPEPTIEVDGFTSDQAKTSRNFDEQFDMANHPELLPFLAMNPALYPDLYAWLELQGNDDIDQALSNNSGYQEFKAAKEE
nr:FHA domain-containing protein [Bifidobacterium callimiconis]